ncbi:MAG: GH36 C-terminal domain-containing protein, partial [Armatimonadetes bacterium]|nr:GH36 C-terminal domain-containing protein [Armatimonadota bacterium]
LNLDYNAMRTLFSQWEQVSPLLLGDYYPLTPYDEANTAWMAWQFNRPETGDGMVQAFRRADSTQQTYTLKLHGLNPADNYLWTNVNSGESQTLAGSQLMGGGIAITISTRSDDRLFVYSKL